MSEITILKGPQDFGNYTDVDNAPALDAEKLRRHSPDATWLLVATENNLIARCSTWSRKVPEYMENKVGLIGHFAASDEQSGHAILNYAITALKNEGCTIAIGPMDGNTWNRYRFITERGSEPPFFLEPDNPDEYPRYWTASGFKPLAEYYSALADDLTKTDPRVESAAQRLSEVGVTIRPVNMANFYDDMKRIYRISVDAFRNNFLYTPIDLDDFMDQYLPIKDYLNPQLLLIAEHRDEPVGFIFNIPDVNAIQRGNRIDTIIVKTVAVMSGRLFAGLGVVLVAKSHEIGIKLGYKRVIHALMLRSNNSLNISGHYAVPFRRYTLYSKEL
jgi:hypothetical protein